MDVDSGANGHLSLFVAAHIYQMDESRAELLDQSLSLIATGFAQNWDEPLSGQPKRFEKLDRQTIDRFLRLGKIGRKDLLASVTVREEFAYDLPYRSSLEVTGIGLTIDWRTEAITLIDEFLTPHRRDLLGGRRVDFLLRLPIAKLFSFPEPRGSYDPYDGSSKFGGSLRTVATFDVKQVELGAIADRPDNKFEWEAERLKDMLATSTILEISC